MHWTQLQNGVCKFLPVITQDVTIRTGSSEKHKVVMKIIWEERE